MQCVCFVCDWITLCELLNKRTLSSVNRNSTSSDMLKRWDRSRTLFLHIWGRPWVRFKVQVTQTVSVLPHWVSLPHSLNSLFTLSCLYHRMTRWALLAPVLLLLLGLFIHSALSQEAGDPANAPPAQGQAADSTQGEDEDGDWGLGTLRDSFEAVGGYFDSMLEFMGGRDGVCQYRCRYGRSARWTCGIT